MNSLRVRTAAGRVRTPIRLALVALVVVFANVAVVAVALGVGVDPRATDSELAAALLFFVGNGIALSVATLVVARYVDRRSFADLGLGGSDRLGDLIFGATLGVALVGGVYLVGLAAGVYRGRIAPMADPAYPFFAWIVLLGAAMIAVGVSEELLIRGYLLTNVAEGTTAFVGRRASVVVALAATSVLFGLLHGTNPNVPALGVVTISLAGLMLGLGYVYTGGVALPIGLHVTWNLTSVLVGLPVSGLDLGVAVVRTSTEGPALLHGGEFGPEGGLLGLTAAAVGCLCVLGYARLTGRQFQDDIAEFDEK